MTKARRWVHSSHRMIDTLPMTHGRDQRWRKNRTTADGRTRSRPSASERVIWHAPRNIRRNNDPCRVMGFNSTGAKRSTIAVVNDRPARGPRQYWVVDFYEARQKRLIVPAERGMNGRSVTFATKEARFHSMNLGIRALASLRSRGYEFIRLYSTSGPRGGRTTLGDPTESKPLGKAVQRRLQSFSFELGLNLIGTARLSFLTFAAQLLRWIPSVWLTGVLNVIQFSCTVN